MAYNVRALSLSILQRVLVNGEFLDQVMRETFKTEKELDRKDRHFLEFLTYGVVEYKESLSGIIRQISKTPEEKMKPKIRLILYLGLFQIFFSEVEAHAAVNESVKLAVKTGFSGLKGFVNGVLRTAIREKETILEKLLPNEKFAVSKFLYEKVISWYGKEEGEEILASLLMRDSKKTCIRVNTSKTSIEAFARQVESHGTHIENTGFSEDTFYISGYASIQELPGFSEGHFYVQDLSSSLSGDAIKDLITNRNGESFFVLDTCASPGGKSLHVADFLQNEGNIISCDVTERKVKTIDENVKRMGFQNVQTEVKDASVFDESYESKFDLVICDAPCSGIGIIGNKPDIRHHIDENSLQSIEDVQRNILWNVSRYVKPGGTLLYSTCTLNPDENENQVMQFLKENPSFSLHPFSDDFLYGKGKENENMIEGMKKGFVTLKPAKNYPGTGFFICRMEKIK